MFSFSFFFLSPLRSLSLSLRSLFMYAKLFSFLFLFFLHWLFQVNRLQMVAAAVAAIFNTGWPQLLNLAADFAARLTSSAQQDRLQSKEAITRGERHDTGQKQIMFDKCFPTIFFRSNKTRKKRTDNFHSQFQTSQSLW